MATLNEYAVEIYGQAVRSGWWDNPRETGTVIALMHSELSEALEEIRKNEALDYRYYRESDGKPEGFLVELSDTIIRILDYVGWIMESNPEVDFDAITNEKIQFNSTRPYKHGKEF